MFTNIRNALNTTELHEHIFSLCGPVILIYGMDQSDKQLAHFQYHYVFILPFLDRFHQIKRGY